MDAKLTGVITRLCNDIKTYKSDKWDSQAHNIDREMAEKMAAYLITQKLSSLKLDGIDMRDAYEDVMEYYIPTSRREYDPLR